jgi:apolipoprotein N-acyltransferase
MIVTERNKKTESPRQAGVTPAVKLPIRSLGREAAVVLGSYVFSAGMLCWIFPPYGIWPLVFVALVPWAVATCRAQRAWLVHWGSFLVGWGFFLVSLRWLMPVTGLGYAALGLYLALYWTLAAWAVRTARRHGISPVWSLPVVWVACEFLRATVMTGFPWLFLAHALYQQLPLIQISDFTGAYGVSFLAALVSGVLVDWILHRWRAPGPKTGTGQLYVGTVVTAGLLVATLAYGYVRLHQADFEHTPALRGPRVAVIQQDFPLISTPPYGADPWVVLAKYLELGAEAAREKPDLIAFPEAVWSAYQNIDFIEQKETVPETPRGSWNWGYACHQALSALARGDYAAVNAVIAGLERDTRKPLPRLPAEKGPSITVLVGSSSIEQYPEAIYPKVKQYNSALVYDRDGTQRRERYDKIHLVPFGEYVPFRQTKFLGFDLHWLYRWLNSLSPFSGGGKKDYSLTRGQQVTAFKLDTEKGEYSFGVPICYEDATPYLIRRFVWDGPRRRVDFLVNISNDGWFLHSYELPQHLAICAFRAVENRVGIARAVNTGISGFIDPNGRIYSVVAQDGRTFGAGIVGYDIQPMYLDHRSSFYGRFGDWFALTCVALSVVLWLGAVFERWVLAAKHRIADLLGKVST